MKLTFKQLELLVFALTSAINVDVYAPEVDDMQELKEKYQSELNDLTWMINTVIQKCPCTREVAIERLEEYDWQVDPLIRWYTLTFKVKS